MRVQDNGGDDLTVGMNGATTFSATVMSGAAYAVTVVTQPTNQMCLVSGGVGVVGNGPVTTVVVTCGTSGFTIGGTVTGLSGTVVLQDNGGDDATVTANGAFAFATRLA